MDNRWPSYRPYSLRRRRRSSMVLFWPVRSVTYEIVFEDTTIRTLTGIMYENALDIVNLLNVAYSLGAEETKNDMECRAGAG